MCRTKWAEPLRNIIVASNLFNPEPSVLSFGAFSTKHVFAVYSCILRRFQGFPGYTVAGLAFSSSLCGFPGSLFLRKIAFEISSPFSNLCHTPFHLQFHFRQPKASGKKLRMNKSHTDRFFQRATKPNHPTNGRSKQDCKRKWHLTIIKERTKSTPHPPQGTLDHDRWPWTQQFRNLHGKRWLAGSLCLAPMSLAGENWFPSHPDVPKWNHPSLWSFFVDSSSASEWRMGRPVQSFRILSLSRNCTTTFPVAFC